MTFRKKFIAVVSMGALAFAFSGAGIALAGHGSSGGSSGGSHGSSGGGFFSKHK